MRRRVHIDNLRGTDPVTLEVLLADAVRRPLAQLAAATLGDLLALVEVEAGLTVGLVQGLKRFWDRVQNEVPDIPDGPPWDQWTAELLELDPERAPRLLRELIEREAARTDSRNESARARARDVLAQWADTEPTGWELGTGKAKILRSSPDSPDRTRGPRRASAARDGSGGRSRAAKAPRARSAPLIDVERQTWLKELCVKRLSSYAENGLAEKVLIAGLVHRARQKFDDVGPHDIVAALNALQNDGVVTHKVRRWSLNRRW